MKIKTKAPLLILLFICFLISCEKETPCPTSYDMGTFELLSTSKELYPYKDSVLHIIFRDSLNNEITATAIRIPNDNIANVGNIACLSQPDQNVNVRFKAERLWHIISIPDLNIGFEILFMAVPNFTNYEAKQVIDMGSIIFFDGASTESPPLHLTQISIVINARNHPPGITTPIEPASTLSLLGSQFSDVFTNNIYSEEIIIHYNHAIGIVGFKLQRDGNLWVFNRFE